MERIIFSVIIPCYNVEKYISKTIDSVLNQTFDKFELILINDGSKDKTKEIIEFYGKQDRRIKIINKTNEGVSETRNLGIKLARGEYLYFLDGDDYVDKSLLESAYLILKNKEIGMFSFGYDVRNKLSLKVYSNKKYNREVIKSKEFLKLFLKRDIHQSICSFIVRKKFIKNLDFNNKLITGEDLDFQMRLLLKNNFNIFYNSSLYFHYIKRENSATTQKIIPLKNLYTLDSLNLLRDEMLIKNIYEFKEYHIIRFFSIVRGLAEKSFDKRDYKEIKNKLKKSEYILKDLNFEFSKKNLLLNFLKIFYLINLKLILIIFKIGKVLIK